MLSVFHVHFMPRVADKPEPFCPREASCPESNQQKKKPLRKFLAEVFLYNIVDDNRIDILVSRCIDHEANRAQ